jgi:hypothetical protein
VAIVAGETVIVENNAIDGQGAISPEQQGWAAGASVLEGATDVTLRANTITAGPCAAPLAAVSAGIFVDAPDAQVLLAGNRAAGALGVSSLVGFSDGVEIARGTVTLVGNVLVGGLAFGVTGMAISAGVHTSDAAEPPLLVNNTARGGFAMWVVAAAEFETGATLVNNVFIVETGMAEEVGVLARGGFGLFWLHHNDIWCRDPAHCSLFGVRDASGDGFEIKDIDALNRCAWDYCMAAEDNIAADPLLAGANDFHLQTDSPCIDAGTDPTAWFDGPDAYRDFDGDPRPLGGDWDIGADEAH